MSTLVMKFGGQSVGTTTALTQVLSIVLHERARWDRLLLVVSALEGVTDNLIEAAHLAQMSNRRGYRRIVATLRTRHLALADHLPIGNTERLALRADVDKLLFDVLDNCQTLANNPGENVLSDTVDSLIGAGERLAARIVAALLRHNDLRGVAIDSDGLIVTDDAFGYATPNIDLSREKIQANLLPMLERNIIPVVTGFIGTTPEGRRTTLGRGGSDYTASVVSICADAEELWVWTDVDGMMTTDPREIDEARVIPQMSYDEVAEMAFFGARVLHPRMVAPLQAASIALRVKNVFKPNGDGTLIAAKPTSKPAIKAVTAIQAVTLSAQRSGPITDISAFVDEVLQETLGSPVGAVLSGQSAAQTLLCVIIPTSAGPGAVRNAKEHLERRLLNHETLGDVWQASLATVVTVIGTSLSAQPIATVLDALGTIKPLLLSVGPATHSLSIVVAPNDAYNALAAVHECVLQLATQ